MEERECRDGVKKNREDGGEGKERLQGGKVKMEGEGEERLWGEDVRMEGRAESVDHHLQAAVNQG